MIINGEDYGFFYSVWAHCEYSDYIVKNPEVSMAHATVQKAIIMNEAFRKANNGGPKLTTDILFNLPGRDFIALQKTLKEQEKEDTAVTVEAEPVKGKGKNA